VAFDLMSHLDLFNLFYTYTEVIVNGKTQGVYLMVQKPKNYAFKQENANFMLRRDYDNKIKKTYFVGDDSTYMSKYEEAFLAIYNDFVQKEGKEFYEELSEVLDVEQYFTWMAFNFLIGNKDYTDEVFFFNKASGDCIKFGIIPWDYDDIFMEYPHEGYIVRQLNYGDKLAFSSEDALDYNLITNDYTYSKYLQTLADVIEEISVSELKNVFELTYQELYPYYNKKDILKVSKSDKYGKTNLKSLEINMQDTYSWLVQKRESTAKVLAPIVTSFDPTSGAKIE
jgi:spore coat protein H